MSSGSANAEGAGAAPAESRSWWGRHSELGVCLLLAVLGVLVLVDVVQMPVEFTQRGPIGPQAVPTVVGVLLLVIAGLLARDVLRGGHGESESGEDVDLSAGSDWRTVLLLSAAFFANVVLLGVVGFPLAGALLFWGSAYALGSRHFVRDPLIAAVVSLVAYLGLNNLLGVPLPGGPLMGVL